MHHRTKVFFAAVWLVSCRPMFGMQEVHAQKQSAQVASQNSDESMSVAQQEAASSMPIANQITIEEIYAIQDNQTFVEAYNKFECDGKQQRFNGFVTEVLNYYKNDHKNVKIDDSHIRAIAEFLIELKKRNQERLQQIFANLSSCDVDSLEVISRDSSWMGDIRQDLLSVILHEKNQQKKQIACTVLSHARELKDDCAYIFKPTMSIETIIQGRNSVKNTLCQIINDEPCFSEETPENEVFAWFKTNFSESMNQEQKTEQEYRKFLDIYAARLYEAIIIRSLKDQGREQIEKLILDIINLEDIRSDLSEAEQKLFDTMHHKLSQNPYELFERVTKCIANTERWFSGNLFIPMT